MDGPSCCPGAPRRAVLPVYTTGEETPVTMTTDLPVSPAVRRSAELEAQLAG